MNDLPPSTDRSAHVPTALLFVILALAWGSSFLLIKVSLEGLSPPQVATVRVALGAITLWTIMAVTRRRIPTGRRVWLHMSVVALTQCALPFLLTAWVGQYLPSSLSSIYNSAAPTMTVLFTPLLLPWERLRRVQLLGLGIGVVGVVVLISPWQSLDATDALSTLPAQLGMLASAAIYGFGLVYMRRFVVTDDHDPVALSTIQVTLAGVLLLPAVPFALNTPVKLDLRVIIAIILLGCICTGVAYAWGTRVIREWGATRASTVTYLMPVVGVALGVGLLGEQIHPNEPIGGAVILAGVLITQLARPTPADSMH